MILTPIGSVPPPSIGTQMPPRLTIFGTVAASTTRTQGDQGIAPKYADASLISSGVIAFAIVIIRFVFVFRASALFRLPDAKSLIVWMKYDTGRPDTGAFSGRPLPWARWQRLHAKTLASCRPLATIEGMGGCASGNQSAGPKRL